MAPPRVYENRTLALSSRVFAVLGFVAVGALGLVGPGPDGAGDWLTILAAEVLVAGPMAAAMWAVGRPRLVADDAGLVVRNELRTRRIPWAEVASVRIGRNDHHAVVVLRDGDEVAAHALQSRLTNARARARIEQAVGELNEAARSHRRT